MRIIIIYYDYYDSNVKKHFLSILKQTVYYKSSKLLIISFRILVC